MTNYFTDYEVLNEDEALNLLPKGKYEAWVQNIYVKPGKNDPSKNHVMLDLDVYDINGTVYPMVVGCYFRHMLRHLCQAVGCLDKYESKTLILEEHIKGKQLVAQVGIQEAQNGYARKNVVTDFEASPEPKKESKLPFDDDVGF